MCGNICSPANEERREELGLDRREELGLARQ